MNHASYLCQKNIPFSVPVVWSMLGPVFKVSVGPACLIQVKLVLSVESTYPHLLDSKSQEAGSSPMSGGLTIL